MLNLTLEVVIINQIEIMSILKNMQIVRRNLNITQEEVASNLNITIKHISEIERGISFPSITLFIELLSYYNEINGQYLDCNVLFYKELTDGL